MMPPTLAAVSRRALAAFGLLGLIVFNTAPASAETVIALPGAECREVRQVRTLTDLQAYMKSALQETGWRETEQTARFAGRSKHGRHVFAVTRNNAICVTTIQVDMVPGATPPKAATEGDTIFLGSLRPFEREWWIAVDCFHF